MIKKNQRLQYSDEKFGHLKGKIVTTKSGDKEYKVTEESVSAALVRLINGCRKKFPEDKKLSDEELYEKYLSDEDILGVIPSVVNLIPGGSEEAKERAAKEVKFEDVRRMKLGINNYVGYEDEEKESIEERLVIYKQFYYADKEIPPNDEYDLRRVVELELEMDQLKAFSRLNVRKSVKDRAADNEYLAELNKQKTDLLKQLNLQRQQRDNNKNKNINTNNDDYLKALSEADKNEEILLKEIDEDEKEEQRMIKEKNKRKKSL